jgi:nicotinamidase-related amidase
MGREPNRTSDILEAVALLVVDMQDSFLNVVPDSAATVQRCAFAIETARAFGLKVLFTEQVPAKLGPTSPRLIALAPDARVFAKNAFSALQAEGLPEYLRKLGIYHLLLAGIETPVCIYQTALHAHDSDLDVTVLSDCVTGRRLDDGLVILEALSKAECHVLPSETVFYSMLGTSTNPRFPAFNALIKKYSGAEGTAIDDAPVATYAVVERTPSEEVEEPSHHAHGGVDEAEPEGFDEEPASEEGEGTTDENDGGPEEDRPPRRDRHADQAARMHSGDRPQGQPGANGPDAGSAAEEQQPRMRSRRRRGGARRRKARERAAAAENGEGGESSSQPQQDAASADDSSGGEGSGASA